MISFEEDYFDRPFGTKSDAIRALAEKFISDPFKAPEQIAQAQEYLDRVYS